MALTTVNKLSKDAEEAIKKLIREDGCTWLNLAEHIGKICIYDSHGGEFFTLKDGLQELIQELDHDIEYLWYGLTSDELKAFRNLCNLLHVDYE